MKATIITLAVAALLSVSNSFGSNTIYKSVETNEQDRTITTTVCQGENEKYLSPIKRYVIVSDSNGSPIEKKIYEWNSDNRSWVAIQKYNYDYNADGKLLSLAFTQWNKITDTWAEDVQYAMYINDTNEENLSVNYLDTKPITSEIYVAHYSY